MDPARFWKKPERALPDVLRRCFYFVFLVLVGNLFLQTVFFNRHFPLKAGLSLLSMALWLAVLADTAYLTGRGELWLRTHRRLALLLLLTITVLTQLAFYRVAACWPVRDLQYIHDAAYEYTISGRITGISQDYLYKFPNNLPVVALLQLVWRSVYRVAGAGFTGFTQVGAMLNAVAILLGYLFTFLTAEQLLGLRWAVWCWAALYLCMPLQMLVSYYYTDTLTLCFAPLALYLWLRLCREKKPHPVLLTIAVLGGLCVGAGITLKVTVAIVLIAIAIDAVLRRQWRPMTLLLCGVVLGCILCRAAVNAFAYQDCVLDAARAPDEATPYTNWVAMGLYGDGSYTPDINLAVWTLPTREARQQYSLEILRERYEAFGGVGNYLRFLNQKSVRSFGSGDLETPGTVGMHLKIEGGLAERLVYVDGAWHLFYEYWAQGWHLAVFFLMLLAAALALRRGATEAFVPLLSVFGLYLFLLLWEASQRYLINYLGIFVLAAAVGLSGLSNGRRHKPDRT